MKATVNRPFKLGAMIVESATVTPTGLVVRHIDARGVARIALNRPEVHNAWNPDVVAALGDAIAAVSTASDVRVVVLTGEGRSFSAGGDLRCARHSRSVVTAALPRRDSNW